jgi:carbamoyl-phosphate synthase small subunit
LAAGLGPDRLGLQLLFALGVLLLIVALVGAMRRSWARRAEQLEDDLPDLPEPPEDPGTVLAAPLRGTYLGTVDAGHWLEWIAGRGVGGRAGGYVTVYQTGVQVDRDGTAFWIPREAVRGARLERAHAGKVASPGRLIVIAWSYGDHELETGFRGEDRARQPKVVRAVHDLIGPATAVPADGEITNPRGLQRGRLRLRARADVGPPPGARGGRTPVQRAPVSPEEPFGQELPVARPYPGARPYANPGARTVVDPRGAVGPGGAVDPRGAGEPHGGPATTPMAVVVRPTPQPHPAQPQLGQPPLGQPHPGQPHPGRPQAGGWPQAGWPQAGPADWPPSDADTEVVDPLTSPLGEVVRRMRDDR